MLDLIAERDMILHDLLNASNNMKAVSAPTKPKYPRQAEMLALMYLAKKWSASEVPMGDLALSWCRDRVSGTISISAVRLLVTSTAYGRRYSGSCDSCRGGDNVKMIFCMQDDRKEIREVAPTTSDLSKSSPGPYVLLTRKENETKNNKLS